MLHLYHAGTQIIEKPDIRFGRKNADFGQGFYLSDDQEFSRRWARDRKGLPSYLNAYALDLSGLHVKRFARDAEWFAYIFANRANQPDALSDYDVLIGPIANDTLYDTWGVITSGLLQPAQALRLLTIGPAYAQTVIKTDKAVSALRFTGAEEMCSEEIAAYRETVRKEERQFQERFAEMLDGFSPD